MPWEGVEDPLLLPRAPAGGGGWWLRSYGGMEPNGGCPCRTFVNVTSDFSWNFSEDSEVRLKSGVTFGVIKITPNIMLAAPLDDPASTGTVMRRDKNGVRYTRFVFTLNNWTQVEYDWLTKQFKNLCTWMCIAKETAPRTGTPHLQGACVLGKRMARSRLATLIGFKRAWHHTMNGKPEHSDAYCSKQDLSKFEHGTLPTPGKRSDLLMVTERMLNGETMRDMVHEPECAVVLAKYPNGLNFIRKLASVPRTDPPKVFWLFGPTGVGKTRCCFESAIALGCGDDDGQVWISSGGLKWFDGYDNHKVVIFDDFRSKQVPSFSYLLRLLDRYPMQVEIKGGYVNWNPEYIFITCPYDPDQCFATRKEHVPEDVAQLNRRITKVLELRNTLGDQTRESLVKDILRLSSVSITPEEQETQQHDWDSDLETL